MLAPLCALLTKGVAWKWGRAQEAKKAIKKANFLIHYDPCEPLGLQCDASIYGLGAMLSHRMNGKDYLIGFRSRSLTAQKNYLQLEKEGLALVYGVTKFRDYLLGNRFTLVTDHKPLAEIFQQYKPIPQMAVARIQRWALLLSVYQYELEY